MNTFRQGGELQCQPCVPFSGAPEGASGCYQCLDGYYRVPFQVTEQGVESNVPCANTTHLDPEFFAACCRSCDAVDGTRACTNGTTLADLPVKRNYWPAACGEPTVAGAFETSSLWAAWCVSRTSGRTVIRVPRRRATELDERPYRCFYKQSCVGSRDGENSWGNGLCRRGHKGPLCNVCENNYYFSTTYLRCNKCGEVSSPGIFAVVVLIAASLLALAVITVFYPGVVGSMAQRMILALSRNDLNDDNVEEIVDAVDDEALDMDASQLAATKTGEEVERSEARSRYMITKLKIVIATYQIVGGIMRIFPTIRWPLSYSRGADLPLATPRPRRGSFFDESRRRRGRDADLLLTNRVADAAAATRIFL